MIIPFAIMMTVVASMLDRGQDYQIYRNQIMVTESRIVFGDKKSGATVDVIGTVTNASAVSWVDLYFHVDFFDANGKRTDAGTDENYQYFLPANEMLSFKLTFTREFPETNYVKAVVRVMSAKDAKARF